MFGHSVCAVYLMLVDHRVKLIKDFVGGHIVLYWVHDENREPVSPYLSSLTQAEEWWLNYQFGLYEGEERRATHIDRRRLETTRNNMHRSTQIASHHPDGRRYTDREIAVDEDRSRISMMQYYARNSHLLEGDE